MSDGVEGEESGGVQGLRAWAAAATERAVRLFPFTGGATPTAAQYDESVTELTELVALLDHDPALRGAVTVRLGSVLALRYLAGEGAAEDRERARHLLRDAREPGSTVGAGTGPEDRRWAALFLLLLVMPVREMGGGVGRTPSFSTLFDWQMGQGGGGMADTAAEMRVLTAEVAELPLPPEMMRRIQQVGAVMSTLSGVRDLDGMSRLVGDLPDGFPYADEMRLMMDMTAGPEPSPEPVPSTPASTPATPGATSAPATPEAAPLTPDPVPATPGPEPPASRPAPGTEADPESDAVAIAVNAIFPTVFAAMEAARSGDPDILNRAIARLRAAHAQLPPGHEMASLAEALIGSLLHLGQGVGGNLQDQSAARAYTREMTEKLAALTASPGATASEFKLLTDLFTLIDQVRQADEARDVRRARELVDELEALAGATPRDHDFRFQVLMAAGQACTTLGGLTGDADMLLRGVAHQERAAEAGGMGAALAKEWLTSLTTSQGAIRAAVTEDPSLIQDRPPPPGASTGDHWTYALSLVTRHGLTQDRADLDAALAALEQVRDGVRKGEIPHFAADALWKLAEGHRTRWARTEDPADLTAATTAAMEALHALAADVVLQLGSEHGLVTARSGAERGVQAAVWAASHGRVEEAVAALELGRALVLRAASASRAVPELLRARGHHDLAEAWHAAASAAGAAGRKDGPERPTDHLTEPTDHLTEPAADRPSDLPSELPSTLRRRALEALGYRHQGLFTTPTVGELRAGVREGDADALVYLLAGRGDTPGMAVVLGPDTGTGVRALPLLSESGSGPLEAYFAAAAARSQNPRDPQADQAWEEALSTLCDWAYHAVLAPVLTGVAERLAANEQRRRDRPGPPRIVLVPCGRLGVVPWHAARLPAAAPADYACQIAVVTYAASGSQFLRTVRRARRDPATAPTALVADPRQELTRADQEATALYEAFYPGARLYGEFYEPPAEPAATGTPDELLAFLRESPALLHVASHGSAGVRPTVSALHLALPESAGDTGAMSVGGAARRTDPDPGMLTVTRLLDASTGEEEAMEGPLVVLSACETDLSTRDHDEALTLTTAFVSGGARDVVGSRWTTQDAASALMMAVFHHYLHVEGHSPADALRTAQMWMLDPDRKNPGSLRGALLREMDRPGLERLAVWAAFIHQGHPGPERRTA
ncbi:CHAT domain-containing protein [Streptomyces luteocolor]|uniref:CHAT domain-containing protein n=1 Tax=Streptomyces luteocolor TaxID=285500 RepID=UPI000852AB65|nr:CHAT domain-containing protein [Streptomyces luteocolor]